MTRNVTTTNRTSTQGIGMGKKLYQRPKVVAARPSTTLKPAAKPDSFKPSATKPTR